jgi:hypothetical protein
LIKAEATSRPEAAFVLLILQTVFWLIAGISAVPFVLAGEVYIAVLALLTILLALGTVLCALGVLRRRSRARAFAIALEVTCLFGSAALLALPIGSNRGLVSVLVNVALPLAVILLLGKDRETFS